MKIFRIFTTINLFLLILVFVSSLYSQAPEISAREIFSTHKDNTILDIVAWSPNDKFIAIGGNNEGIPYLELLDPQEKTSTVFGPEEYLNDITFLDWNYDSTLIATSYFISEGTIHIWDISERINPHLYLELEHEPIRGESSQISSLDWHPKKNQLMTVGGRLFTYQPSSSETRNIYIWDTLTGEIIHEITHEEEYIISAYWSPDGDYIAVYYLSGNIDLFDGTDFEFIKRLREPTERNNDYTDSYLISWNSNSTKIAGADCDFDNCMLWSLNIEDNFILSFSENPSDTSAFLTNLQWNPQYDILASANIPNREIRLWDGEDGALLLSFEAFETSVMGCYWNSHGNKLIAITAEGDIKIWELTYN